MMRRLCFCGCLYLISVSCVYGMQSSDDLAQKVAGLSILVDKLAGGVVGTGDFVQAHEFVHALQREFCSAKNTVFVKDVSPRVVAAIESVLERVDEHLTEAEELFKNKSKGEKVEQEEVALLVRAESIRLKRLLQVLMISFDVYADNQATVVGIKAVPTAHMVQISSEGSLLASIEALECFAQATHDATILCSSCRDCPEKQWCLTCKKIDRKHSRSTPFVQRCAQETREHVGVNDALLFLETHIGPTSKAIDAYAENSLAIGWQGDVRLQSFAECRKSLLQAALMQKDIVASLAKMTDEQLRVEAFLPLLENAPRAIGIAETAVKNTRSYNPLRFIPAKLFCSATLGQAAQELDDATRDLPPGMTLGDIAKMIRESTKETLGISDKELPLLCQLIHILSRPLNSLIKDGVVCLREGSEDVERFAASYKKPLREQLLTPASRERLIILSHAWRTRGVEQPRYAPGASGPLHTEELTHNDSDDEFVDQSH